MAEAFVGLGRGVEVFVSVEVFVGADVLPGLADAVTVASWGAPGVSVSVRTGDAAWSDCTDCVDETTNAG